MEELIENLEQHNWQDTASNYNGSPIFVVEYGDGNVQGLADKSLTFWNDNNSDTIDCDSVCDNIAELLSNDGLNHCNNSIEDGWNTVAFEIFDNDLF